MVNQSPSRAGFGIDVSCPGCGGELSLQDDFATIRCRHCSSALRISMPALPPAFIIKPKLSAMQARPYLDRFLKEQDRELSPASISVESVYQPYWKFDSLILKLRHKLDVRREVTEYGDAREYEQVEEVKQEISLTPHLVTISASPASDLFPYSLGMRTDYIRMKPFDGLRDDDEYVINPVETTIQHAYAQAEKGVQKLTDFGSATYNRDGSRLFGLRAALVYFPYYKLTFTVRGKVTSYVIDAVASRVVGEAVVESTVAPADVQDTESYGKLGVELHRCTNCGEDLPTLNSFIYCCRNCGSICSLETDSEYDKKIHVAATGGNVKSTLMPFWRLDYQTGSGGELTQIVVPAFRVKNLEAMWRLSSRLSASASQIDFAPEGAIESEMAPANVGLKEAKVLAHAIIARQDLKRREGSIKDLNLIFGSATILLVPFHTESYFLVDSVLSAITIERQALAQV